MNDLIDELTAGGADDNDANNVLATSLFGEHPEEEEEQQDGDVYGAGVEEVDVVEVGDGGGGDIAEEELLTPTGAEEVMDHRHPLLQLLQLGSNGEGGNGDSSVDVVADFVGFVTALQAQLACSFELVEGPPLTRFIERLKSLVLAREQNFVVFECLLTRLIHDNQHHTAGRSLYALNRILDEIEASMVPKEKGRCFTDSIKFSAFKPSLELVRCISNIQTSAHGEPPSGDIVKIYKEYTSNSVNPPPVDMLRQAGFLDKLVMDVMHNTKAESVLNMELWLIGYAVSVIDSGIGEHRKLDKSRHVATLNTLKSTLQIISTITPASNFKDEFPAYLAVIDTPVAAMMLSIRVAELIEEDNNSFERFLDMDESPPLFDLLDEIAIRHPLLRPRVFDIFSSNMMKRFSELDPLQALAFQKVFLDRLLFLIRVGHIIPVLTFMTTHSESISDPLKLHYIRRLLLDMLHDGTGGVATAFPPQLGASLVLVMDSLQVIDGLKELEVQPSVLAFLDSCASPESSNPLSLKKAAASLRERVA